VGIEIEEESAAVTREVVTRVVETAVVGDRGGEDN
jgi:hypothetical protein